MALYVKVFTSFFSSKKAIRLRALLGNDALWIPIRLWAYAAENQPDGDFTGYTATEIALLIGYDKDATSMLQALQQVCLLDGMKIHDWEQYNSYHKTFSERGKAAAAARWSKDKKGKEKSRERVETSIATSIPKASRPSEDEIITYCRTIDLPASDGASCFAKWEGNGWTNNRAPIKDWKATIRAWKIAEYLPSQKKVGINGNGTMKRPDIG